MRATSLALILSALLSVPISAQWTAVDWSLAGTDAALLWVDYSQTRYFLAHHYATERNPLLGPRPSQLKLGLYNVALYGGLGVTAAKLHRPWREILLGGVTVVELIVAHRTARWYGWRFDLSNFGSFR